MPREQLEAMRELIQRLLETLRRAVRNFTERELQTRNHDYMEKFRREMLTEKSFYHLTEDEIRRMRDVVVRLAQRIKNMELSTAVRQAIGRPIKQALGRGGASAARRWRRRRSFRTQYRASRDFP